MTINFVLAFARDLQNVLEKLEKEFGNLLVNSKPYYKKKIYERASELIEDLFKLYNGFTELNIGIDENGSNIILINNFSDEYEETIKIPFDFIENNNFFFLKYEFDSLLYLLEQTDPTWVNLSQNLFQILKFKKKNPDYIKLKLIEKLRFFMNMVNVNLNFDLEQIPEEFNTLVYKPKYVNWRKNSTFTKLYNKHLRYDKKFFNNHLNINAIPNYPQWNLNIVFYDLNTIEQFSNQKILKYFPIQVFEDYSGKIIGIIALQPSEEYSKNKIADFSINNNFNIFSLPSFHKKSIHPINKSIYDSYVKFLEEIDNNDTDICFFKNSFSFNMYFKSKSETPPYILNEITDKMINEYNLLYQTNYSNFISNFLSNTYSVQNPYRYLFKPRFVFLDFNPRENFLLIIKRRKKNTKFNILINFLKNWTYQTLSYELKDKILLFGYLLPNFNYTQELVYLNELFKLVNVEYEFYVSGINFKPSNLSLYNLPLSNQFQNERKKWNLIGVKFPINIKEKEQLMISLVNAEKNIFSQY